MSLREILIVGTIDTVLGMGIVFAILIFISACISLMGKLLQTKKTAEPAAAENEPDEVLDDPSVIDPEIIAVITAAIHQSIKDEHGDSDEYIVRKVRRATWKHTS